MRGSAKRGLTVPAFFYGSYMDPQVLKRFGVASAAGKPGRLLDWGLTFTPHANLQPQKGGCVHGFVFDLTHEDLQRLYGPEGFVTTYQPVPVLVEVESGDLPCMTYVEHAAPGSPEPQYLEAFLDICHRLGLPEDYIDLVAHEAQRLTAPAA